jgi:hypothetical protein
MEKLDFSEHYIVSKKKLTQAYNLFNKCEFDHAVALVEETIAELRLMRAAIKTHLKDTNA